MNDGAKPCSFISMRSQPKSLRGAHAILLLDQAGWQWCQGPQGSKQHLALAGPATRARTQHQENPGSSCGRTGYQIVSSRCINRRVDGGLELPLKLVQARLGHASIQMTADRYGHLFPRGDDGAELTAAEKMFLRRVPRFTAVELAGQSQVPRAPWRWRPRRRRPRCCKYPPRRA